MLENDNVLNDPVDTYAMQQRVKMGFLERQKERLELIVAQLAQNLQLLRHTNQALVRSSPEQINRQINNQNQALEKNYVRILQQNQDLVVQSFLQKQITSEEMAESRQAIAHYEEKILQLRRAIQLKEGFVQNLQSNIKYHHPPSTTSATPQSITMLYYQELQEYKDKVDRLTIQHTKLKKQNQRLVKQNHIIKCKNDIVARMVHNRSSYNDFREWYTNVNTNNDGRKHKSQSKLETQKIIKETQQQQNELLQKGLERARLNMKTPILTDILIKKKLQNEKLTQRLKQANNKIKRDEQTMKRLKQANDTYQKHRKQVFDQLNYYKKRSQEMLKILSRRKAVHRNRGRSQQKSEVQEIIRKIRMPSQITYVSDRKNLWQGFQKDVSAIQTDILKEFRNKRRSLSCVNDYVEFEQDEVDKYLVKKRSQPPKENIVNLANFSMMLDEYIDDTEEKDPFQFSVIKQGERMSYAEMKEMKKNKNSMKKHGLTLIEQDIF